MAPNCYVTTPTLSHRNPYPDISPQICSADLEEHGETIKPSAYIRTPHYKLLHRIRGPAARRTPQRIASHTNPCCVQHPVKTRTMFAVSRESAATRTAPRRSAGQRPRRTPSWPRTTRRGCRARPRSTCCSRARPATPSPHTEPHPDPAALLLSPAKLPAAACGQLTCVTLEWRHQKRTCCRLAPPATPNPTRSKTPSRTPSALLLSPTRRPVVYEACQSREKYRAAEGRGCGCIINVQKQIAIERMAERACMCYTRTSECRQQSERAGKRDAIQGAPVSVLDSPPQACPPDTPPAHPRPAAASAGDAG